MATNVTRNAVTFQDSFSYSGALAGNAPDIGAAWGGSGWSANSGSAANTAIGTVTSTVSAIGNQLQVVGSCVTAAVASGNPSLMFYLAYSGGHGLYGRIYLNAGGVPVLYVGVNTVAGGARTYNVAAPLASNSGSAQQYTLTVSMSGTSVKATLATATGSASQSLTLTSAEQTEILGYSQVAMYATTAMTSNWFVDSFQVVQTASVSEPNQISTMPTFSVNAWPGANSGALGGSLPSTTPVDLGPRATKASWKRGRTWELENDSTGTLSCDLRNDDGLFPGPFGMRMPVQVTFPNGGLTADGATAYVDSMTLSNPDSLSGEASLQASDVLGALSSVTFPSWIQSAIMCPTSDNSGANVPNLYWPCIDAWTAPNAGGGANEVAGGLSGADLTYWCESQDSNIGLGQSMASPDGATGFVFGPDTYGSLHGVWNMRGSNPMNVSSGFGLSAWIEGLDGITGKAPIIQAAFADGVSAAWQLWWSQPINSLIFTIWNGINYSDAIFAVPPYARAGSFFDIQVDTVNGNVGLAWWNSTKFGYATQVTAMTNRLANFSGYVTIGTPMIARVGAQTREIAYARLENAPTNLTAAAPTQTTTDYRADSCNGYTGQLKVSHVSFRQNANYPSDTAYTLLAPASASSQLKALLRTAGVPVYFPADTTKVGQLQMSPGTSVTDALRRIAQGVGGRLIVDGTGAVRYFPRTWNRDSLTPKWVFGSASGEYHYTGSPEMSIDTSKMYNDVTVSATGGNGGTVRVVDAASQAQYFPSVLQIETNLNNPADVLSYAQWALNQYKTPQLRMATLHFDVASNSSLKALAAQIEIADLVQINHRTAKRTVSMFGLVDSVEQTIEGGDSPSWSLDVAVSPVTQWGLLGTFNVQVTTAAASGATQLALAPLPDAARSSAEASLGALTQIGIWSSDGATHITDVVVSSVVSQPTAGATGYSSILVTLQGATSVAIPAGALAIAGPPNGSVTSSLVSAFNGRAVLDSTFVLGW